MTNEEFDALALKVVRGMDGISLDLSTQSFFVEFARRLRDEWLKGMEPVAEVRDSRSGGTFVQRYKDIPNGTPLYTLEELK